RASVLPPSVKARVSVEAGVTMSWHHLVGDTGVCVGLERYGASAPYQVVFEKFGFTTDRVVAAAREALARTEGVTPRPTAWVSSRRPGAPSGSTSSPGSGWPAAGSRPCTATGTWSG